MVEMRPSALYFRAFAERCPYFLEARGGGGVLASTVSKAIVNLPVSCKTVLVRHNTGKQIRARL